MTARRCGRDSMWQQRISWKWQAALHWFVSMSAVGGLREMLRASAGCTVFHKYGHWYSRYLPVEQVEPTKSLDQLTTRVRMQLGVQA